MESFGIPTIEQNPDEEFCFDTLVARLLEESNDAGEMNARESIDGNIVPEKPAEGKSCPALTGWKPEDIFPMISPFNPEPNATHVEIVLANDDTQMGPSMTEAPQLLNQATFSKPWEQTQHHQQHQQQQQEEEQKSRPEDSPISIPPSDSSADGELSHGLVESVNYMKRCLDRYDKIVKANGSNGKIQVHQVVSFMLLSVLYPSQVRLAITGVLVFCDSDGKPTNRQTGNFLAKDTKAMGQIWQLVKENRRANFDTFARAMRVCRERRRGAYFTYLDTGKGSKKRIYGIGRLLKEEMHRMKTELLDQICLESN